MFKPRLSGAAILVDRDEVPALFQALFVQQPCSNPSECPESLRKALCEEYAYLQLFRKPQKFVARYRADSARRRSGVRSPSAPLTKLLQVAKQKGLGKRVRSYYTIAAAKRLDEPPTFRARRRDVRARVAVPY